MRNPKSFWCGLFLLGVSSLSGGCIDGVAVGFQTGVEDAVASVVETLVNLALEPMLPAE